MAATAKRTFSLPAEHAKFIDAKVASEDYASGSEVVRAGLRALQERDAAVERWLREEVGPPTMPSRRIRRGGFPRKKHLPPFVRITPSA